MVAQWFHRWAEAEALMDCPQIEAHPAQLCFLLLKIMATRRYGLFIIQVTIVIAVITHKSKVWENRGRGGEKDGS